MTGRNAQRAAGLSGRESRRRLPLGVPAAESDDRDLAAQPVPGADQLRVGFGSEQAVAEIGGDPG